MFWFLVDVIAILGSVTVLSLAVWLDPDARGFGTHEQLGLSPCRYYMQEGALCPTCGLTTAFANMAEGRVVAAFRANPVGIPLFILTLITPLWFGHALWARRDPFRFTSHAVGRWALPALLVSLVVCWALKVA